MSPPVTIAVDSLVGDARELCEGHSFHHLLVAKHDQLEGVLCECDLWWAPRDHRVDRYLRDRALTADADLPGELCAEKMLAAGIGCLPVLDRGEMGGIVTLGDLLRHGIVRPDEVPVCLLCRSRHHVRALPMAPELAVCRSCMARPTRELEAALYDGVDFRFFASDHPS